MTSRQEYAVTIVAREQAELLAVAPDDRPLEPPEVAGRTLVTLISAGTELASAYQGERFPTGSGYAAVFEVEAVGKDVSDISVGDVVFCLGPHRSFQRAARSEVVPVAKGLAPEVAVFIRMMGVTMTTLTTTAARPPEKVLVTGLGTVGNLAAQMFASCGYEVLAADPDERRRDIASEVGVKSVFPAVPVEAPDVAGKVALVIECSGHEQAVLDGCRVVRKRGEVVLVGSPWRRRTDLTAHELTHAVFHRYVVLRSGWEWELPRYPTEFRSNSIYENLAAATRWLEEGRVRVEELHTTRPPREAQQAYQDLLNNRCPRLTTVFDWTDCP